MEDASSNSGEDEFLFVDHGKFYDKRVTSSRKLGIFYVIVIIPFFSMFNRPP